MTAVLVTRCVFLFVVLVPVLGGHAQQRTNEEIAAEKRHLFATNYCKGVMGASQDDVLRWERKLTATQTGRCFGACMASYLQLHDPPIVTDRKLTEEHNCRVH